MYNLLFIPHEIVTSLRVHGKRGRNSMKKKLAGVVLALLCVGFGAYGQAGGKGILVENAFKYVHVDGHKHEEEMTAFVLFEYEQLKTVKYQVAYLACTCRGPEVNYYSVAYVELSKDDGSVKYISYDLDSDEHYIAGMYGDSEESWDGTEVKRLFAGFIKDKLFGKSQESINAIKPMHGDVDAYTGATVTPNNAVRMLQSLFKYHNAKYR